MRMGYRKTVFRFPAATYIQDMIGGLLIGGHVHLLILLLVSSATIRSASGVVHESLLYTGVLKVPLGESSNG